jgi:hypothetical protein
VTVQGGFPHFENLNYTGAMTITGGHPYFRGLTGGGRITLNGVSAVLSVSDCNMDMALELANITVTAGQLIVNGGLFTNSGTTSNIVFNNTNLTDLTKAHMLGGVVTNTSINCNNALTVVGPTCIAALTGNAVIPTPMIPAFGVGGGTAQAQTATVPIFATSYFSGLRFSIVISVSNTATNPTMNLNSLGAKTVKNQTGGNLKAADLLIGTIADFVYDGTYLRLMNPQAGISIDNSSLGYFDIGAMRIQWGTTDTSTITFPAAFKDTNYSFTANVNSSDGTNEIWGIHIASKTTTTITIVRKYDNAQSNCATVTQNYPASWIAIGLKP